MNKKIVKHILVDDGSHLSTTYQWVYDFHISRIKVYDMFHNLQGVIFKDIAAKSYIRSFKK